MLVNNCSSQRESATQMIELMISLAEKNPSKFRNNQHVSRVNNFVDFLLMIMSSVQYQISQYWINPSDGFSELNPNANVPSIENLQDQLMLKMRSAFDRFALAVGYSYLIKITKPRIQQFCANKQNIGSNESDWRAICASLFLISQLGETDDREAQEINDFVMFAVQQLKSQNPKVRYGALHCLGQLSDDLKPQFQNKYTESVFPLVVQAINDKAPRVASHALACITNFIQDYEDIPKIQLQSIKIIQKTKVFLQNPTVPSYIKQNSLSAIASLATIAQLLDQDRIALIMNLCQNCLKNCTLEIYKQIRNQAIQTISIIISTQSRKYTEPYFQKAQTILFNCSDPTIIDQTYIISGWQRFLIAKIVHYPISQLMPKIKKVSESLLNKNSQKQSDLAVRVYESMVEFYGFQFKPFAEQIVQQIKNCLQDQQRVQIWDSCISFLIILSRNLKSQAPDQKWGATMVSIYKYCSNRATKMLQATQQTIIFNQLTSLATALSEMLGQMGIIADLTMASQIFQATLQQVKLLDQKIKVMSAQGYKAEYMDTQQQQQMSEDNLNEALDCRLIYPDIFQSLLRIVPNQNKKEIIVSLFPIMEQYLKADGEIQTMRCGFYYIDNFLDECQYQILKQHWDAFHNQLYKYSTHSDCLLRNSAVYGFGLLIMKTPKQLVSQQRVNEWIQVLWKGYNMPKTYKQKHKQYLHCQQNCVSALGRLLSNFGKIHSLTNVYKQWLKLLPLNTDKLEGNIQQKFLMDLVKNDPGLIIEDRDSMVDILSIYARFAIKRVKTTKYKQELQKTKVSLLMMSQWPIFQQNKDYIWGKLAENQRYQLVKLSE